jgi:hypothetical protein
MRHVQARGDTGLPQKGRRCDWPCYLVASFCQSWCKMEQNTGVIGDPGVRHSGIATTSLRPGEAWRQLGFRAAAWAAVQPSFTISSSPKIIAFPRPTRFNFWARKNPSPKRICSLKQISVGPGLTAKAHAPIQRSVPEINDHDKHAMLRPLALEMRLPPCALTGLHNVKLRLN